MKHVNSDIAYAFIRKKILSGEYRPGMALMTSSLSDDIGVSRTPVRDALRQLETDGLVTIQPRLGASVKSMTMREYREMSDMRLALETHAAGLAATNRSEDDLQAILMALEGMRVLTKRVMDGEDDNQLLPELRNDDVRFHVAILTASKNELMKKEILRIHLINRVASTSPKSISMLPDQDRRDRRQAVLNHHEVIYAAIRDRDVAGAKAAMQEHLQELIDYNLRFFAQAARNAESRTLTEEELLYLA